MSDYSTKRIDVYQHNVDRFYQVYGPNENITRVVNDLLERFMDGHVVELGPENYDQMKKISDEMDKEMKWVVNVCLSSVEFVFKQVEKTRVEVIPDQKPAVKKKLRGNPITNY